MKFVIASLALAGLFAFADDSEACHRSGGQRLGLFRGRCGIAHRHDAGCSTCAPAAAPKETPKTDPKTDPKKETKKK